MKLYFLRHGIAADREEWTGDDASRPLTSEGRKCMDREAKGMEDLNLCPDRIITSPLKRAKETAQIVAERLHLEDKLVEDQRLADSFDAARLSEILSENDSAASIMLVGHEPDFSETIGEVIGGASIDLKKGGLARIDLHDASATRGELVWLIPPKALMR